MLKSRIKRLFGIILTLFLCVGIVNPVYASDDNFVNEEMAYQIAVNFALGNTKDIIQTDAEGDLAAHEIAYIEEGYPNEFIVYEIEPFYDYNENISAYNIKIKNLNNEPSGYVIVSANKQEYPIIEYAYDGTFYMETLENQLIENKETSYSAERNRIYYNGNYNYCVKVDSIYYHILDDKIQPYEPKSVSAKTNNVQYSTKESQNITNEWNAYTTTKVSSPPIGSVITDSDLYESGYSNRSADYCAGMPSEWFLMTDFSTGGVCAPTAGTNLCYYWTLRDNTYSNLLNGSWAATFSRISTLMGADDGTGASTLDIRRGILSYFKERGYASTETYYSTCSSTTHFNDYIKSEINVGRPVILSLLGDDYYGEHAVLGVGYVRYMYSGTWSSHYIRIADGWHDTIRFIHYETGRDTLFRTRVIPGV